ncbi:hypothetical protein [uncultured Alistipes sp.]|uniref:hypothetical protein n=1 Tax=uncultured Alistipes sp. TaxID=538949 RepID=UPI0026663454|nr:hypothetical protein [uncultured Alistipes sp.]
MNKTYSRGRFGRGDNFGERNFKKLPIMTNLRRRIRDKNFLESLNNGYLRLLLNYIIGDEELDIQIRDNYINVYYKGGNILRIRGEKSFEFDEFYFYDDCKTERKTHLLNAAKEKDPVAIKKIKELRDRKNKLIGLIKDGNYSDYFSEAKKVMDSWWNSMEKIGIAHNEKKVQHQISRHNKGQDSDYTVLDLEYQVSTKSEFCYIGGRPKKTSPRFDIIAIHNKTGELCIIELKKGLGAINGKLGIEDHCESFKYTIGRDEQNLFLAEMKDLCDQKCKLGLIDSSITIKNTPPKFVFAFAGTTQEYEIFMQRCRKENFSGKIIYLNDFKLLDTCK